MIIDCHGHYTTAPEAHNLWRRAQVAAYEANESTPPYPTIPDDEIRESIETNQLRILRERGADMTIFSPRASAMEQHVGDEATSQQWSRACNDLIKRVVDLFPDAFIGVGQLPQSPGAGLEGSINGAGSLRHRTRLRRLQPQSRSQRRTAGTGRRSPIATGTRSTRRWSNSTYRR